MAVPYYEAFKTLFSTIFLINTLGANVCNESLSTVQQVTFCPRNFNELQLAVKRKRCDSLANIQTCVSNPNKFVYHCLVNQQNDGFVEVCAPEWILAGYCGYYDTVLDKIVANVTKDCTKFPYPCPRVFNSSDSYKYQVCYEVRKKEQGIQICEEKGQAHPSLSTSINHVFWIVPSILAVGFFLAFIFACLKIRKMKFEAGKTNNSNVNSSYLPQDNENQLTPTFRLNEVYRTPSDNEYQLIPTFRLNEVYRTPSDNENQLTSTIRLNEIYRTPSESNAATGEDTCTSGKGRTVSKRKNTPLTEEEIYRRLVYRQNAEKNREKQRRLKEITSTSTPIKIEIKSTKSESNLRHNGTPCDDNLKHSKSFTGDSCKGKTEDGPQFILEQMSTDTYATSATEGDISEISEEDLFIKKSKNTPSSEEKKSRKKRNRRRRNKGNKRKAKQNGGNNYETN